MKRCICVWYYFWNPHLTFYCFIKSIFKKVNKDLWMFTKHHTCKMSFDHIYNIAYIIWINKLKWICASLMTKWMITNNQFRYGMFGNPNFAFINILKEFCMNILLNKNIHICIHDQLNLRYFHWIFFGNLLIKKSISNIFIYMGKWLALSSIEMSLLDDKS